tara:strand:- start:385 stop:942 length:558 start_codon:yes stop_codon:yes gene_type:complete
MKPLFIHIPKCAGISVKRYLLDSKNIPLIEGHYTCSQMKAKAQFINYKYDHIFTIVRNPYSKLVSTYLFLQHKSKEYIHLYGKTDLNTVFKNFTFDQFVKFFLKNDCHNYHYMNTYMFLPQKTWLDTDDDVKIYNFENLNELNFDLSPYNKNVMEKDWGSYYNDELKEIVSIFYNEDFKMFNYQI